MRRKDKESSDRRIIEEILSNSEICHLAMVDRGMPYLVPVNFGYDEKALYVHSATTGKKIDILKQNNRICFQMDYGHEVLKDALACNWTARYRSLIGFGTVEILTGEEEKKYGLNRIMAHYGGPESNVFNERNVKSVVILKINIDEWTMKQSGNWETTGNA